MESSCTLLRAASEATKGIMDLFSHRVVLLRTELIRSSRVKITFDADKRMNWIVGSNVQGRVDTTKSFKPASNSYYSILHNVFPLILKLELEQLIK